MCAHAGNLMLSAFANANFQPNSVVYVMAGTVDVGSYSVLTAIGGQVCVPLFRLHKPLQKPIR